MSLHIVALYIPGRRFTEAAPYIATASVFTYVHIQCVAEPFMATALVYSITTWDFTKAGP